MKTPWEKNPRNGYADLEQIQLIKPDSKTTILVWKVFQVEIGVQAVQPWLDNPN